MRTKSVNGWLLGLAVAAAAVATPLSGSAPASASGGSAAGLCSVAGQVTGLVVTRGHPLNPERFGFPRVSTSTDAAEVRAVARELCALPAMPRGIFCPADWSPTYTLAFSIAGGAAVRPVVLSVTGCSTVAGLGSARWVDGHTGLWTALGAAIGLSHATASTFAGTLVSH